MDGPKVEMPQPKSTEVRYPGFKKPLLEVTTAPSHVAKINEINNALDPKEYDETGAETTDETLSWLKGGTARKFSNIRPESSKRAVVGAGEAHTAPTSEMIIGVTDQLKGIDAYVYAYEHSSPFTDKLNLPDGVIQKELSFVTDVQDDKRDPEAMAEAMQQTAMMLWELQAGKTVDQLDGTFTAEQLEQAKKLQIFATAGRNEDEINYVWGLAKAGFIQQHVYQEDGETQLVCALDIDRLLSIMQVKKEAVSQ